MRIDVILGVIYVYKCIYIYTHTYTCHRQNLVCMIRV